MRWGFLSTIGDVVIFLLCCIDGKRGEQVKHHAIVKQLARHSPWAFMSDTLKIHKWVAFCLLNNDLVPQVLALRREQIQVECEHLACSSGRRTLEVLGGFLGLLKINLESCLHSIGFLGLSLGFLGFL
jgi:hypothetical protein